MMFLFLCAYVDTQAVVISAVATPARHQQCPEHPHSNSAIIRVVCVSVVQDPETATAVTLPALHKTWTLLCNSLIARSEQIQIEGMMSLFFLREKSSGGCFWAVLACACSSPTLFSPLTKHHAAGWRSRQRQQIRGTQERREKGGGRGGRTPRPQSTMSYLVLCPPCRYRLHMYVGTVHSCFFAACRNGSYVLYKLKSCVSHVQTAGVWCQLPG